MVSFVIHPSDMPDALAVAPLGQRYMLALAAIGDDEKPMTTVLEPLVKQPVKGNPFTASERGKERYASASDMERARTRAALLPKDARFQAWAMPAPVQYGKTLAVDVALVEQFIRDTCCVGESRKLIAENEACYRAFVAMETQYLIETNQMAEPR